MNRIIIKLCYWVPLIFSMASALGAGMILINEPFDGPENTNLALGFFVGFLFFGILGSIVENWISTKEGNDYFDWIFLEGIMVYTSIVIWGSIIGMGIIFVRWLWFEVPFNHNFFLLIILLLVSLLANKTGKKLGRIM